MKKGKKVHKSREKAEMKQLRGLFPTVGEKRRGDSGQWFQGSIKKRSVYQNVITCVIWSIKKRFIHIDTPPPPPPPTISQTRMMKDRVMGRDADSLPPPLLLRLPV